jgi:GNAT superfamily N-acetyltransferase
MPIVNRIAKVMIDETLIRRAHPGDAGAIARIHVDSWRAVYRNILPRSFLSSLNHGRVERSILSGMLDSEIIWLVAEEKRGVPVGYICGGPQRFNNQIYQSEVYELYVAPGFQRHGFGRRLLSALAHHLYQRRSYSLMVWVLASNPNHRFYEKAGGLYLGASTIAFAGKKLRAAAYGWIDISLAFIDQ